MFVRKIQSYYSLQQRRKKDHVLEARQTSDSIDDLNEVSKNEDDNEQRRDELNAY